MDVRWSCQKVASRQLGAGLLALSLVGAGAGCSTEIAGPEARFVDSEEGRLQEMPWPSDAYRVDGRVRLAPLAFSGGDAVLAMESAIESMDGFGTTTSIFFPVSEPVALAKDATGTLVDLETQTALAEWPLYFRHASNELVALAPRGTALKPGHMYAMVISDGVAALSGLLHPSAAMKDALAARGRFGKIASYQKLRDYLQSSRRFVLAATAFTTHTRLGWFSEVAGALAATPHAATVDRIYRPEDLDWLCGTDLPNDKPGLQPGGGTQHDAMAYVLLGHMTGPSFLPRPNDPAAAQAAIDGTFEQTGTMSIPWALVLPKRASYAGTKIVHFQHGLGSNRSNVLVIANEHAKRGFATFAIDTLFHGDRVDTAVDNRINATRQDGQDGFADLSGESAVINFFAVNGDTGNGLPTADPRLMRDHFRQAAVDLMQALRFEKSGDLAALRAADPALADLSFDGSNLVYTGESFGAMLGSIVLAEDPELKAAVLDVGGGGIVLDLVVNSPSFSPLFGPLATLFLDNTVNLEQATPPARAQLSLNLAAMILEPGDGLAVSAIMDPSKSVLLLEAKDDEVVPNTSTEALAVGMGAKQVMVPASPATVEAILPQAPPPLAADPVRGLVLIAGSTHTQYSLQEDSSRFVPPWPPFQMRESSVKVVHPIVRVRGFALDFIDSIGTGTPRIDEPKP